jgi:NAD-dependent DNA ligase
LLSIQGIGPKAAAALIQVAIDSRSRALVEAICGEIRVQDYDGASDVSSLGVRGAIDTTTLEGQTVVFTGKMRMITRKRAEAVCSERGANVGKTVTRDTTLLVEGNGDRDEDGEGGPVTDDSQSLSVKAKKARALGVKIVSEKEFLELYKVSNEF